MNHKGDTIVFDIETQNFFTDPGVGRDNFGALKISVVVAYSYLRDDYGTFEEHELSGMAEWFGPAKKLVGFSMNRYDIPVLNLYFRKYMRTLGKESPELDLWQKQRVDLLDEIERAAGHRISLNKLAEANLGASKSSHGSEAIEMYKEGRMDDLKEYCKRDVELTKLLFEQFNNEHYFLIPSRTGPATRLEFPVDYNE
jgi:DEAD/DEAH box helicase domain-containing protein